LRNRFRNGSEVTLADVAEHAGVSASTASRALNGRGEMSDSTRQAVLEADGKRFVYVLRSGEDFERREITVGDEHGAQIAVEQGLKAGERLVTQGAWQLRQQELRPTGAGAHTHE